MSDATRRLHDLGQSLWLDGASRTLLRSGALSRDISELSVTGLRFDPDVLDSAMADGDSYEASIGVLAAAGLSDVEQYVELALEDLTQAAELLRPIFDGSGGTDGWVSLGISPLLADNAAQMVRAASQLHAKAALANLLVRLPGTAEGLRAVEDIVFEGIPVEIAALFSPEHYLAAADAWMRGLERRSAAGLHVRVDAVCTILVGPWDAAVKDDVSSPFRNRLGLVMAMRTYRAHRRWLASDRWLALASAGARPHRLVWAGVAVLDPTVPDTLYVNALMAPGTVACLPRDTLLAFAAHGAACQPLPADAGFADAVLRAFRREGVDDVGLGARLQREAVEHASATWRSLMRRLRDKGAAMSHRPSRVVGPGARP